MATLLSILAALFIALITWYARQQFLKRRLYCVAPHVFEYSQLAKQSSVAFIQLQNAGRQVEDDVELCLSPTFHYELIASTATEVAAESSGTVRLSRLRNGEQVGLLFLVEGASSFRRDQILSIKSKDATGKIVTSAAEIGASTPKVLGVLLAVFLISGLIANIAFEMAKDLIWPTVRDYVTPANEIALYPACISSLSNAPEKGKNALTHDDLKQIVVATQKISRLYRRGDFVYADIELLNPIDIRLEYRMDMKSTAADSLNRPFSDPVDSIYGVILLSKGSSRKFTLAAYLPASERDQLFWIDSHLKVDGGLWINYEQRMYLDKAQADACLARSSEK